MLINQEYRLKNLGSLIGVAAFKWHSEVASGDKKHFKNDSDYILWRQPLNR